LWQIDYNLTPPIASQFTEVDGIFGDIGLPFRASYFQGDPVVIRPDFLLQFLYEFEEGQLSIISLPSFFIDQL